MKHSGCGVTQNLGEAPIQAIESHSQRRHRGAAEARLALYDLKLSIHNERLQDRGAAQVQGLEDARRVRFETGVAKGRGHLRLARSHPIPPAQDNPGHIASFITPAIDADLRPADIWLKYGVLKAARMRACSLRRQIAPNATRSRPEALLHHETTRRDAVRRSGGGDHRKAALSAEARESEFVPTQRNKVRRGDDDLDASIGQSLSVAGPESEFVIFSRQDA